MVYVGVYPHHQLRTRDCEDWHEVRDHGGPEGLRAAVVRRGDLHLGVFFENVPGDHPFLMSDGLIQTALGCIHAPRDPARAG